MAELSVEITAKINRLQKELAKAKGEFKGLENFKGMFIHPQNWDENLDYKNKKVVVIGSGATAVTIVPSIANDVAKVTMLQRSPTYIAALPNKDKIAGFIKKVLPRKIAHQLIRAKNIFAGMLFFKLCKFFNTWSH